MVEQIYRVKRDGRKSATSDLISNEKEPIKVLTLATKGKEVKQSIDKYQSAKSEEKKLRVHKAKKIAIGQNRITAEMPTRLIVLAKEGVTKA